MSYLYDICHILILMKQPVRSISDLEKLKALVEEAGIKRAELARLIEVTYRTIHRWLDEGILPHPRASRRIDELFKENIDLVPSVQKLKKSLKNPLAIF